MRYNFTIWLWDVSISTSARCAWTHFKIHHTESGRHIVWGRISVSIENHTLEVYPVCAACDSPDIGGIGAGDESWTVCESCQGVEQGTRYVNAREYDRLA